MTSTSYRDYPDFYTKLYGMLDRQVLHVRYRARFLRMLDLFLSSTFACFTQLKDTSNLTHDATFQPFTCQSGGFLHQKAL